MVNEELVARVKAMVDEDARISLEEIASALNISSGSASSTLRTMLGFRRVCAREIPHVLTPQQKRHRVAYSNHAPQDVWTFRPKASRWTGNWWWNLAILFWTFEKSNGQSMSTECGDAPQIRKAMSLREAGPLHNIVWLNGHCATETTQDRKAKDEINVPIALSAFRDKDKKEHHGGILVQRRCSFRTEQILQKRWINLRHA